MLKTKTPSQEAEYRREHYYAKANIASQRRIHDKVQRLNELKLYMGCCVCGYAEHAAALAFHHTEGDKEIDIARAVWNGWGWERIEAELDKCDVICHNCHAIKHWGK